jgi:acyl-CoA synthetase (NDP forming)
VIAPANVSGKQFALDEWQSKKELSGFGLQIPEGRLCVAGETVEVATSLGFPVVLKAVSVDLAHKSDVGAVAVNLLDDAAVEDATRRMARTFDQFLVETMAGPTVAEIIIGVSRDATFGLTLLIGAGGTLVELLDDTASLLLPAQRDDIRDAIMSLKIVRLVQSYRGAEAGDIDAIVDAAVAVANYAVENNDTLLELDINPLIVLPHGAVVADAYIRKRQ